MIIFINITTIITQYEPRLILGNVLVTLRQDFLLRQSFFRLCLSTPYQLEKLIW